MAFLFNYRGADAVATICELPVSVPRLGTIASEHPLQVVPCIVLAVLIHPVTYSFIGSGILWAFCLYLESVSVLPQLQLMQNAKMVEPFTARYVFALGVARFLGFAFWIIRFYETRGAYHVNFAALLAEIVQTFILADFCYYYVKSSMFGELLTFNSHDGVRTN